MKRILLSLILIVLVIGLAVVGCAKETPSPAPTPAPTKTEPIKIDYLSTSTRQTGYKAAFALSEIVNK